MSKPFYYLWAYDAHADKVNIDHNDDHHPADEITHTDMLEDIGHHPDNELGYAYRIDGGWRITNDEHDPVEDPHVIDLIKREIRLAESD